jgi:predicted HicB family RNase H-like nuclease
MLNYKGYIATVEFDDEAELFHGEVVNTRDVITFQATTAHELKQAFIESVDDYLAFCAERNEQPEKPFSGKINLRLTPELHKQAYAKAKKSGKSLNQFFVEAISHELHH